ncbi:Myb-related protein [Canna indica]|uniref:Myb-related protein n=1 Tax=Canna indica TaxID=4628 RepID=A0AAQ3JKR5_9LILI|nr:Myb-related protein [Canna indica]
MDSKVLQNQAIGVSDAPKPRLKWTLQLHLQFVDAVSQLGGVEKATPKSVMRVMGIPGLTLYHLKSHLQKYRLAKNQESIMLPQNRHQDRSLRNQVNEEESECENMLKMQIEVQRKIEEQIEVQRHLQLRIEAQGKYLQSVLKKAQETLAGYNLNATAVETELSEIISAVETECLSSSISQDSIITQAQQHGDCSGESCLTSGDVPVMKQGSSFDRSGESDELNPMSFKRRKTDSSDELCRVKRISRFELEQVRIGDLICRKRDDDCCCSRQEEQELDLNM